MILGLAGAADILPFAKQTPVIHRAGDVAARPEARQNLASRMPARLHCAWAATKTDMSAAVLTSSACGPLPVFPTMSTALVTKSASVSETAEPGRHAQPADGACR